MSLDTSPILTQIVVDGDEVIDQVIEAEVTTTFDKGVNQGEISFKKEFKERFQTAEDLIGRSVVVWRGVQSAFEKSVFRGEIGDVELRGGRTIVSLQGKLVKAKRRNITTSFDANIDSEGGVVSEIVKSLLGQYTDLNFDDESIQQTSTSNVIQKFTAKNSNLLERLEELADRVNSQIYYDSVTDKVYLEPRQFRQGNTVLRVGENIVERPDWTYDKSRLVNELTVNGATQSVEKTVFSDGTGNQGQQVELEFQPTSVKVFVGEGSFNPDGEPPTKPSDKNENELSGGKESVTAGTFDYEYDDDQDVKTVFFSEDNDEEPSFIPPTGTNNIQVDYTYDLPTPLTGKDEGSIQRFGLHQDSKTISDIKSVGDAEQYLNTYLEFFSTPFLNTTTIVDGEPGLSVGRVYRVVDSTNSIDGEFLLSEVTMSYPYTPDEVVLGDEIFRKKRFDIQVWDRLQRLEEKDNKTGDLLVQIFNFGANLPAENRFFELERKSVAGETGVYGNPTFGLYGNSKYGGSAETSFVLGNQSFGVLGTNTLGSNESESQRVVLRPGGDVFEEFVYDDLFFDSGLSGDGVVWDTVNEKVVVPQGQEVVTKKLCEGIPYNELKVSLGDTVNGDSVQLYYSTSDGESWVQINEDENIVIQENILNGLRLKVENIPSQPTGLIMPIQQPATFSTFELEILTVLDNREEYSEPAIRVVFN